MATEPRSLITRFDDNAPWGQLAYPHEDGLITQLVGLDAGISGTQELPNHLPMAFDTSLGSGGQWFPWDPAGANGREIIRGFIHTPVAEDRVQSETGEKKIPILMRGVFNRAAAPLEAASPINGYALTYTDIQLEAALIEQQLRDAGITVTGLEQTS